MAETLYVKNMVCPRCISAVRQTFTEHDFPPEDVVLGEVRVAFPLSQENKSQIDQDLKKRGFQLLEPGKAALIARVKAAIVEQIHHTQVPLKVNFSHFLAGQLHHEYTYLSRLFSSIEGITIEKYITAQKIEHVKELLYYDEKNLSEIAHRLDYSSVAHLSSQFKKETGMTPTAFKKQKGVRRSIDDI